MYNFDIPFDRRFHSSIKWDRQTSVGECKNLIPFAVADMDFPSFPGITKALEHRVKHGCFGYTYVPEEFYTSYINWCKKRYNLNVKKEEIISCPGIVPTFAYILNHMTNEGDKIMLPTPHYDPFFYVIEGNKRIKITSSLIKENGIYTFDFNDIENKFKNGIKMFILCNPHTPTGRSWNVEELTKIVKLCNKYSVLLFVDEIHCDIILGNCKHHTIFNIEGSHDYTILAQSPGKTFNMAGLKTATLIVKNKKLCQDIRNIILNYRTAVNLLGWTASIAAYTDGENWTDELVAYLRSNAEFAVKYINENIPRIKTYMPEATYLLWLDFSEYGLSQEDLINVLVSKAGVNLNDGSHYGAEGIGYARLNFATQRSTLLKGLENIKSAFKNI